VRNPLNYASVAQIEVTVPDDLRSISGEIFDERCWRILPAVADKHVVGKYAFARDMLLFGS
jgi:hypothetical protein